MMKRTQTYPRIPGWSLGLICLSLSPWAMAQQEQVLPVGESVPPPNAFESHLRDETGLYLGSWTGCSGRNNRSSGNTLRGHDPNTSLYTNFTFYLQDTNGDLTRKDYRIKRPATAVRPVESLFHQCTRVPTGTQATQGGWNGATCANTNLGQEACKYFPNGQQGVNQRYHCAGGAHPGAPNTVAHDVKFNSNAIPTEVQHVPSGGASHSICRPVRNFTLHQNGRLRPAVIECKHFAADENPASVVLEISPDSGLNWQVVPSAGYDKEISMNGFAFLKIKNINQALRVQQGTAVTSYLQEMPSNASPCAFGGCNGAPDSFGGWVHTVGRGVKAGSYFWGADGFCAGFHSPLMLFFQGEKLPQFSAESKFAMGEPNQTYTWPEKGSGGWLLAQDPKGDRVIENEAQLFGSNDLTSNGFNVLAQYDQNQDGKIDSSDKIFDTLVLWNDRNSDSRSQKQEVKSLKEAGVISISLNYNSKQQLDINGRAKARERSSFLYRKKGSKKPIEGIIYDIWFAEVK